MRQVVNDVEGDVVAIFVLLSDLSERRKLQLSTEQFASTETNFNSNADIAIIGTEWTASEFAVFNNTPSAAAIEMRSVLEAHPGTIGFELATEIYGNAGCNDYFSLRAALSADRLSAGGIATTRMICNEGGVMEQEREYTDLLSERSFFYQVVAGDDEVDELVLTEVVY